jgi:hypothetical protein
LKVLLALLTIGLTVGLTAALAFAWRSQESKTIAIATATLFGAALLFALQLRFELRSSEDHDLTSVEYTVDRAQPLIRQWIFEPVAGSSDRLGYEHQVSEWLAKNHPDVFDDRERLTRDVALAEMLLFLAHKQFDWQLATTRLAGKTAGTFISTAGLSKPDQCAEVRPEDIEKILTDAGNRLAGLKMSAIGGRVCLPPESTVTLRGSVLMIANPFGTLRFELMPIQNVSYMKPRSGGEVPMLKDGGAQFETRVVGIQITNARHALYSQHRDVAKYDTWRKNVVAGLHEWFEH